MSVCACVHEVACVRGSASVLDGNGNDVSHSWTNDNMNWPF